MANEPKASDSAKRLSVEKLYCELLEEKDIRGEFIEKVLDVACANLSTLANGFITVKFGEPRDIEDILNAMIHKETLEAEDDDEEVKVVFQELSIKYPTKMRYAANRNQWEVCGVTDIMNCVRAEVDKLRVKEEKVSVPLKAINFIILKFDWMKGDIMEKVHQSVTIALSPIQGNKLTRLLVTAVRIKMKSAKAYIAKLVSSLETKEVKISFARALFLQSWNTQKMLLQIEEADNCRVEVLEKRQQVVFRMSSPEGQQVLVCEGSMAITDCHVLMLPLYDGQEVWPPTHKQILEKGTLSDNVELYRSRLLKEGSVILQYDPDDECRIIIVDSVPAKLKENETEEKQRVVKAYTNALEQCNQNRQSVAMEARLCTGVPLKTSLTLMLNAVVDVFTRTSSACRAVVIYTDCALDSSEACSVLRQCLSPDWRVRPSLVYDPKETQSKERTLMVCAYENKMQDIIQKIKEIQVPPSYRRLANIEKPIPLPEYILDYLKHHLQAFRKTVGEQVHHAVKINFMKSKAGPGILVTAERTLFQDVERVVHTMLVDVGLLQENVNIKEGRSLQSPEGHKYIRACGDVHQCHIITCLPQLYLAAYATSPLGKHLLVYAGNLSAEACHVVVLPLCEGQAQWPDTYSTILTSAGHPADVQQYAPLADITPRPRTVTRKHSGAEKPTIVVMHVPKTDDGNYREHVQAACTEALSITDPAESIALPVRLSADVPLETSLRAMLPAIVECLEQSEKWKTVLLYLDAVDDAEIQSLVDVIEEFLSPSSTPSKSPSSTPSKDWVFYTVSKNSKSKPENRVKVLSGELEHISSDIVVNTTDPMLSHMNGLVSSSLLKAAGQDLVNQCRREYPDGCKNNMVVVTESFKLKHPKKIYHIVLPQTTWSNTKKDTLLRELRWRVLACLALASSKLYSSIAFPAIGTGNLNYPAELVARTMFTAVNDFFADMPHSSIKEVTFVCLPKQPEIHKAFKVVESELSGSQQSSREETAVVRISGTLNNAQKAMEEVKKKRDRRK